MDFDLGLSDDDEGSHSDLSFGSLDVDLPMDAPPPTTTATAAKPAAAAPAAAAPSPAAVATPAPAPAPAPASAQKAIAPTSSISPPSALPAPSQASSLAAAAAAVVARKRAAAEAQAAEDAKNAPPPRHDDDEDDFLDDGSDGSLNFSSDGSLDMSDDEPAPQKKPAAAKAPTAAAAAAAAPAPKPAAAQPSSAASQSVAAPGQAASAASQPTTQAPAPVAAAPTTAAPVPTPAAVPTAAAAAPASPDHARENSFSLGSFDDDLDLGHDDLDFDFDKRASAGASKVSSAVASPAPQSRTVKPAPPTQAQAKQTVHSPPPAAAPVPAAAANAAGTSSTAHVSSPGGTSVASSSSLPSVSFIDEDEPAFGSGVDTGGVSGGGGGSAGGDDRDGFPASTNVTQPNSQAGSPSARAAPKPLQTGASASASAPRSPEASSVASAEEYVPSRSHFAAFAPPSHMMHAQQFGAGTGTGQGRSTAETVAAARERQQRKDEYAERVLAGQESTEATLYEHGSSGAWTGGNADEQQQQQQQQQQARRRVRNPRPPKPEFTVTSKTPVSKKLQQAQREALLYNNTPRTSTKKKQVPAARRAPYVRESRGAGSAQPGDLSDEEAAMARLTGSGRGQKQALEPEDAPVEYGEDAPWLDSVSNVMGGLGGAARGPEGRPRGHRASIVFQQHEPLVGQAADVEALSTGMQQLFEMQRAGAADAAAADQVPRVRKDPAPRGMVTIFGQRVPANQFPSFAPPPSQQQQRGAHKKSTAPLAVGGPRTQAEQAQVALAAALASIRPVQPVAEQGGEGASSAPSPSSVPSGSPSHSPFTTAAALEEEKAAAASGVNEVDDPEEAAQFDAAFAQLSPDEYYAHQLALQNAHTPGYALPAIDFTQQLRVYAGDDTDTASQHPEMDDTRRRRQDEGGAQQQQDRPHDPVGYTLPVPSNTGTMYLRQLNAAARKKAAQWVEVSSVSAAWGASLDGTTMRKQRGLGPRGPDGKDKQGQYARNVQPGRFSVEKKRARKLAQLVEQRTAQHALSQQQAASYPLLEAGLDPEHAGGNGGGGAGFLSLMGLAYSGVEDHPALQQHMQLLDGHPEAAHFLAGNTASDAFYAQQYGAGSDAYGGYDDAQSYDGPDAYGYGQAQLASAGSEHGSIADPAHSHVQRMRRSRELQQQQSGVDYGSGTPGGQANYAQHKQTQNNLKAELMGALHAGLFGAEESAQQAQSHLLQLHEQEQDFDGEYEGEDGRAHSARGYGGEEEEEEGGRLPFVSPHRLSEAGGADSSGTDASGAAFHFKNASSGQREFVAAMGGVSGNTGAGDDAPSGREERFEGDSGDGGSVYTGSQSTMTNDETYDDGYDQGYGDPGYAPFGRPGPSAAWEEGAGGTGYAHLLPPEHQSAVVPPAMMEQVVAAHFLGRDLRRTLQAHPSRAQQTSKSASKRRTDQLMQRVFNPEQARADSAERAAAAQAAEKEARVAKRKQQAARRSTSAGAGTARSSRIPVRQPVMEQQQQQQQHPRGPASDAYLSTLNEESQSQGASRTASQTVSQAQSPSTSSINVAARPGGAGDNGTGGGDGSNPAGAAAGGAPIGYTHVEGLGMVPIIPPSAFSVTHDDAGAAVGSGSGADAGAGAEAGAEAQAGGADSADSGNLFAALAAGANNDAYGYGADEQEHDPHQQQQQQMQHQHEQQYGQQYEQQQYEQQYEQQDPQQPYGNEMYAQAGGHPDTNEAIRAALRARQHAASVEAKKRATALRQKREAEIAAISARYNARTGREPSPPRHNSKVPPSSLAGLQLQLPPGQTEPSRLDMLYYKAKLSEQKLTSMRAAKAAAELASCTFQPNLEVVEVKGKVSTKASLAALALHKHKARSSKKKRQTGASSGAGSRAGGDSDLSEDDSSVHSSSAASQSTALTTTSTAVTAAAAAASSAANTKARLDALYASHQATQAKIRLAREEAARAAQAAEAALTFTPNVHPHRPVSATVALAHTRYIKGFDEKVGQMRRGAQQASAQHFAGSLRPSAPGSAGSMNFSLDPSPVHASHADYIAAGRHVVLSAQVPLSAPGPGTDSSTLPFAATERRESAMSTGQSMAAPAYPQPALRPDSHTPVPQIVMRGAPGSSAPIQMLCGTNPGSPSSLNFSPSANRATFVQDGQALEETMRRADGRGPAPASALGPDADQNIGVGSLEGTERLQSPTVLSAVAAAASAAALNPGGLGLGIVLPNNSPGSVFPRALALHDHVSSYSYQYTKKQIIESGGPIAPTLAPAAPVAAPLRLRSGQATPIRTRPPTTTASAGPTPSLAATTPQPATVPAPQMLSPAAAASPSASAPASAAALSSTPTAAASESPAAAFAARSTSRSPSRLSSPAASSTGSAAADAAAAVPPAASTERTHDPHSRSASISAHDEPDAASAPAPSDLASPSSATSGGGDESPAVLLFVDIELGAGPQRIVVHVGDRTEQLAADFTRKHQLDAAYAPVIQNMLDQQIAALPANE